VILRREANGLLSPLASEPPSVKLTVSRIVADAALRRLCTLCSNCTEDARFRFSRSIHNHNVTSLLCVPTVNENEVTGMIYLDSTNPQRPLRREHLHLAAFIGRMMQLIERLHVTASGNPVTPSNPQSDSVLIHDSGGESLIGEMNEAVRTEPYGSLSGAHETDPAIDPTLVRDEEKSQGFKGGL
jgi:transcriptional regulator with GAF, ATPase, and Fis domain